MLAALQTVNPQRRTVVFLCAPPGTGKSTLTTFWEYLAQQDPELPAIQTLPMDGFHHYNSWLDAHQLRPFKGAPETFDVARKICARSWKGIVRGRSTIDKSMILLKMRCTLPHHSSSSKETGCLLLDDEKWLELASFCDFSIFIHAPAQILRERLISRKIAGGLTRQVAEAFYARTDGPNVERVLMNSRQANLIVEMTEEGRYHFTS